MVLALLNKSQQSMRLLTAFFLFFTFVNASFGQIKYENGYFINNDNKRIECLIKNKDWKNNPTEFSYKLLDSSASEDGNLSFIKEFGIYNFSKYINADVKIDRSKLQATELIGNENPLWSQEKLFLKVLLEGRANLYCYDDGNGRRFFYSVNDTTTIQQLVYKKFRVNFLGKNTYGEQLSPIAENNTYKDQLLMDLSCPNSILESVEVLNYKTDDLVKYFIDFNKCMGVPIIEMTHQTKRSDLNLKLAPGINLSSISIPMINGFPALEFKRNVGYSFGLEFESLLPFNKDKWGIVFEPTFQFLTADAKNGVSYINYKFVEFPIGLRYYFYLNAVTKFYINGFYISNYGIDFKSKIELYPTMYYGITPSENWAFGGGMEHKRLSIETRYHTNRYLLRLFDVDSSRLSFILGYKIFTGKR